MPPSDADSEAEATRTGPQLATEGVAGAPVPEAFRNDEVSPEALPDFRAVTLQRVSARYTPYAVLTSAWFWPALAVVLQVPGRLPEPPFIVAPVLSLALAALALPAVAYAVLDARRRGWAVREHDLISRSGVLWQRTMILPFSRIQHVETINGPLERLFGLMRVRCFTAGGMSADLTLKGLSVADARRVRHYLLEQIRDDVPVGTEADEPG